MHCIHKVLTTVPDTQHMLHNDHLLSWNVVGLEEEVEFELELKVKHDWVKTAICQ